MKDEGGSSLRSKSTRGAKRADLERPEPPKLPDLAERAEQFRQFWQAWPNKVAKPAAEKAFDLAAREAGFNVAAFLDGVDRYVRDKPADRSWLNPATFINQRRWQDEPAPTSRGPPTNGHRASAGDYLAKLSGRLDAEIGIENEHRDIHEPDTFDGPILDLSTDRLP